MNLPNPTQTLTTLWLELQIATPSSKRILNIVYLIFTKSKRVTDTLLTIIEDVLGFY